MPEDVHLKPYFETGMMVQDDGALRYAALKNGQRLWKVSAFCS